MRICHNVKFEKNMISINMNSENEHDLLVHWFKDLTKKGGTYKEPILGEKTVQIFKQICDVFEQNTQVFIMAIELTEDYIRAKKYNGQMINDSLLAGATIVFMCHKYEGSEESLKVKHVVDLMTHFTQNAYTTTEVMAMEADILVTLDGKFPLTTVVNDMDIVIEKYVKKTKLKAFVQSVSLNILEYVYMQQHKWFKEVKDVYRSNKKCVNAFHTLITSKLYIPVSVLVAAIELTHIHHTLDVDIILADVKKYTKIHENHFRLLVGKIIEMLN